MRIEEAVAEDYSRRIQIQAPIDRVYALLTTLEGIAVWWEGHVSGDPGELGELRFGVADSDDYTRVQVAGASFPSDVAWLVLEDSGYGALTLDTSMVFHLQEELDASTSLAFHHQGLTPLLDCFADCATGWDRRLERIKRVAESDAA
ncbi:MAG: SRPBCC domain-containing protein [Acetobacteraceae bacterium]|jgi:uncharacterized protein YndB with AHSA1/START domain|nr:MAG: SRPBCC domain-containing protein [Acetobacteraceae bacterium]